MQLYQSQSRDTDETEEVAGSEVREISWTR